MTNSTWAKETFIAYLKSLLEAGIKATEIATNLGVHKDTVYAWRGSNEKRHISEATAIKLMVRMESLVAMYLPTAALEEPAATIEEPKTDNFQAYEPGQVLTTKDLAAELGTTPKSLRRWLRKRFGKAEDGTWTFTLKVAEEIKADFEKKAPQTVKCWHCDFEIPESEAYLDDEENKTYLCKACLDTVSQS